MSQIGCAAIFMDSPMKKVAAIFVDGGSNLYQSLFKLIRLECIAN